MIPTQAVEKAIEGGWKPKETIDFDETDVTDHTEFMWERVALDPTFWQALGKALGWREEILSFREVFKFPMKYRSGCMTSWEEKDYLNYAVHRFYDLVLQGEDTADYWKELLADDKKEK